MMSTSFWSPDGKPISSAEFVEQLFGDLPEFFKDEDELRSLWSNPSTRRKLLERLEEKGYGESQLAELREMINAEKSDLYDLFAYIAFARTPISREERVNTHKHDILAQYDSNQQEFLDFVLNHYVTQGVGELSQEKLPQLLELKYQGVTDAIAVLGNTTSIREMFIDFQKHLYEEKSMA